MAPRDEAMLVHMLHTAIAHEGPAALRYPRGTGEGVELPAEPELIPIGRGEVLVEGERVALLGYGYGVTVAREAAAILAEHGLKVTVADARFAKPLDGDLASGLAREHELLVTIEENVLPGGFGSAVLEHLEDAFADEAGERARVLRVGLPDATSPTASRRCCGPRPASPVSRWPTACSPRPPPRSRSSAKQFWGLIQSAQSNSLRQSLR